MQCIFRTDLLPLIRLSYDMLCLYIYFFFFEESTSFYLLFHIALTAYAPLQQNNIDDQIDVLVYCLVIGHVDSATHAVLHSAVQYTISVHH